MNEYERQAGIRQGDRVQISNGEIGTVIDVFRKDGELRVEVELGDDDWLTVSSVDLKIVGDRAC